MKLYTHPLFPQHYLAEDEAGHVWAMTANATGRPRRRVNRTMLDYAERLSPSRERAVRASWQATGEEP